jgi:peptide/nickel transport system substrate-binding protein
VRRFSVVAICVVVIAAFGPIAGAGATVKAATSGSSQACTQARSGGSITFGQLSIQPTLDPGTRNVSGAGGADVFSALYDTLLRLDPTTGAVGGWLASGITHNPGYTQYTLKLRPNLKFGNGDALDAAAVVAAQNRYLTKGNFTGYASYIKAITAVDPTTVQYDLTTPWTELPIQLAQVFGMIADPKTVDALGAGFATAVNAGAGAGPYEVTTFNPPSSVVLKAKTNYWGGPVCIQQITMTTPASPQQGLDSFNTGQYDMNLLRDPVQFQTWQNSKPRVGTANKTLVVGSSNLFINTTSTSAHLDDVRVRQALQLATNVALVNQRGYQGTLMAHTNLVPATGSLLKPTKATAYNLAAAKKLLDQVKSETGWDGSMHLTCSTASSDQSVALAAVYNNAGFKITLDPLIAVTPWVTKVQVNRDYDIACGGLQVYNDDYWQAFYARTFAPTNYGNFHNPQWTAAMADLAAAPLGSSAYQTAINKVQKLQNDLVPQVIYGSFNQADLMQSYVKGMLFTVGDITLFGKAYTTKK